MLELVLWSGTAAVALAVLTSIALRRPRLYLVLVGVVYVASQWRQSVGEVGAVALVLPLGSVNVGAMDVLRLSPDSRQSSVPLELPPSQVEEGDSALAAITILTALGVAHWVISLGLQAGVNGWGPGSTRYASSGGLELCFGGPWSRAYRSGCLYRASPGIRVSVDRVCIRGGTNRRRPLRCTSSPCPNCTAHGRGASGRAYSRRWAEDGDLHLV